MSRIWLPGNVGENADLDLVTATASDVLRNIVIIDKEGNPLIGTLELTGNAADSQVLSGRTYYNTDAKTKRTGSMLNQGTKTAALKCGESYIIPAGYHSGAGKVTANNLASQTSANAAAGNILSGKTAFVNGSKVTGSMPNKGVLNWEGINTIHSMPAGYYSEGTLDSRPSYNAGYSAGMTAADNRANANSANYKAGYNAGVAAADNRANANSANYKAGYSAGMTAADNRANTNSTNYKTGYNAGYSAGMTAADNRANANSTNYKTGYNAGYSAGMTAADNRANANSANYKAGYNAGVAAADNRTNVNSANYKAGYGAGMAAGKSAQYNAAALSRVTDGNAQTLSFSATTGIYIAAMAGDPGHYENFSVSGATIVSNIGVGDDVPPAGSRFARIILLKVTSNTTVTINWGAQTRYAIVTRLS